MLCFAGSYIKNQKTPSQPVCYPLSCLAWISTSTLLIFGPERVCDGLSHYIFLFYRNKKVLDFHGMKVKIQDWTSVLLAQISISHTTS